MLQKRLYLSQDLSKAVAWNRYQYIAHIRDTFAQLDEGDEIIGETGARQVASVDAIARHAFKQRFIPTPNIYPQAAAGKLQCERGSPGTGTDDRDRSRLY